MAYYTLVTRYEGRWCSQFGDHERATVEEEQREVLRSPDPAEAITARDTRIIKTPTAHQWAVDRALAALNAAEGDDKPVDIMAAIRAASTGGGLA